MPSLGFALKEPMKVFDLECLYKGRYMEFDVSSHRESTVIINFQNFLLEFW